MKRFLKLVSLSLLVSSFLSLLGCDNNRDRELYIYSWSDYFAPDLISEFEEQYNCKIIFDYYDSNESMYAKLKVSHSDYDLVVPSTYMSTIMFNQNMLRSLDKSKMPNLKYIDHKYMGKTKDPDMNYGVPYMISFTGIGYNKNIVKDIKPSWSMFGDRKYRGRMTMLNDMREAIGSALKYLGYSYNSTSIDELNQAKVQMLKWKENLAAYQVDEAKISLGAGILLLIQEYNGDIYQVEEGSRFVSFILPEEGTSIGIDTLGIPVYAVNTDLAYKFINFLYKPENAAKNMKFVTCLSPNSDALKLLDPELIKEITVSNELFDKSEVISDLGEFNEIYVETWDEIKAE